MDIFLEHEYKAELLEFLNDSDINILIRGYLERLNVLLGDYRPIKDFSDLVGLKVDIAKLRTMMDNAYTYLDELEKYADLKFTKEEAEVAEEE